MTYGLITARLRRATPADGGSVTFEPTVPVLRSSTGLYLAGRTVRLATLADPYALDATDDPELTPTPWQWRATFAIPGLPLAPVVFDLPAGEPAVELFDLVSLAIAPSVVEVVSDADRRRAEAAALSALQDAERAEAAAARAEAAGGGPGAAGGIEYPQLVPRATWTITHGLGRRPSVSVYDANGSQIETDVQATTTTATIAFPEPTVGSVVLS